jgi:hypothetical protein
MGGWRARQLVEPAQHKLRLASFRRSPSGRCGRRICSYCWLVCLVNSPMRAHKPDSPRHCRDAAGR